MLEVSDPDAALERVRTLKDAHDSASSSDADVSRSSPAQEKLDEAGLSSVDEALNEIQRLEEKCSRLASDHDDAPAASSSTDDPEVDASSPVEAVLGIRSRLAAEMTLSLAEDTVAMFREQIAQPPPEPTVSAAPEDILSTMRCLRDCADVLQTDALTEAQTEEAEEIDSLLGVADVDEARALDESVRRLHMQLSEAHPDIDRPDEADDRTVRSTIAHLADRLSTSPSSSTPSPADRLPSLPPPETDSKTESDRAPAPSSWTASPPGSTGDGSPVSTSPSLQRTVRSMQAQLESLYAEKEALFTVGIEDGREAAGHLDELQARVNALRHENEQYRRLLNRLENTIGTIDVSEIAQMTCDSEIDATPDASSAPSSPASPSMPPDTPAEADRLLPVSTLTQLDDMTDEALNDLAVGVLRLDDDGTIEYVNDNGLQLPGLDGPRSSLYGDSLFQRVPSTSNMLFLRPFRGGVDAGEMDVCFPYTFVAPHTTPTALLVHLYRAGPLQANWLLLDSV